MAHEDLYEADFLLWTERQAAELRALAHARRDLPNALDLEHVAEEIEDLGRSELAAVTGLIWQILVHSVKLAAHPDARARLHWRKEIRAFHIGLRGRYAPAMRQRIDLDMLWAEAVAYVADDQELEGEERPDLPSACPFALDELVADKLDFDDLARRLTGPRG